MDATTYTSTMRASALMLGLTGIIAVHVMDLPGKLAEVPYMGLMYIGVILAAGFLIHRVISGPTLHDYVASAGLAAAVLVGYAVNRTVGMPGAVDDIGNWLEPLGLLSLVVEVWVVAIGVTAARSITRAPQAVATAVRTRVPVS